MLNALLPLLCVRLSLASPHLANSVTSDPKRENQTWICVQSKLRPSRMSGLGYAERNLPSYFANSFSPLDLFKADCQAEGLVQGLHLVSLMKDTGLEKDSPASSVPRVCYEPPLSKIRDKIKANLCCTIFWYDFLTNVRIQSNKNMNLSESCSPLICC